MSSLLDIQQKIRALEDSMSGIAASVRDINNEIDSLRNTKTDNNVDYKTINALAGNIEFKTHPLAEIKDEYLKKLYLEMLLNIVNIDWDSKRAVNRLVFIQWMRNKSGISYTLEQLLNDSRQMKEEELYEFTTLLQPKYREGFVVDALITANIAGSANKVVYEYIAEICSLLAVKKDRLSTLSTVSKIILTQNYKSALRQDVVYICESYKHYVTPKYNKFAKIRAYPERYVAMYLRGERADKINKLLTTNVSKVSWHFRGEFSESSATVYKNQWHYKNGDFVKSKSLIAKFEEDDESSLKLIFGSHDKTFEAKAKTDGYVHYIYTEEEYSSNFYVVVTSEAEDTEEEICEWLEEWEPEED